MTDGTEDLKRALKLTLIFLCLPLLPILLLEWGFKIKERR